jgi:hypothetical protein
MKWFFPLPFVFVVDKTPQETGWNAHNNMWRVEICRTLALSQCWEGVLLQEIYESRHKFKNKQDLEVMGHAVECYVAGKLGFDFEQYQEQEAKTMVKTYAQFAGEGWMWAQAKLRAARPAAKQWVDSGDWINKVLGWRG